MRSIDSFGTRVCAVEISLELESAQLRLVWSQSLHSIDSFETRVCAVDSFGARVCAVEVSLEPESSQ